MLEQKSTFHDIFLNLRERIVDGELTGKLPSLGELQRDYNVSSNTVKKALTLLKEQRFVLSEQRKGVYVNTQNEVNILAQKNVTLYLHQNVMMFSFYIELVFELRSRLERERCNVNIINTMTQLKSFSSHIDVLLLFEQFNDEEMLLLKRLIPLERIIYCNCRGSENCSRVTTDNRRGGYMGMEYLYGLGCRRIGVLGIAGEDCEESHFYWRGKGVEDFLHNHPDVSIDSIDVPMDDISTRIRSVWSRKLFRNGHQPDGIFMFMDLMVFALYEVCRELNIKIPVLGYDDRDFDTQLSPALSSLREDSNNMADGIVAVIRNILTGNTRVEQLLIPPILIERESTLINDNKT